MSKTIEINKLPTRTWNQLGVNQTSLIWDEDNTHKIGDVIVRMGDEPARLDISGQGDYSRQTVRIEAPKNAEVTVFETLCPEHCLHVQTLICLGQNALVRLVQLYNGKPGSLQRSVINGVCAENARMELIQIMPGCGDIYSDEHIDLQGDGASFSSQIGYLGGGEQVIDMNMTVNHLGCNTNSEINVSGALRDSARKVFRGTIDFKAGSAGSVGNEKETVLMLGENVVNKTVPLILCAEENVEGNHGATIGEMDDETAFYFESRGISREAAEILLSHAAIEHLVRIVGDKQIEEATMDALRRQSHELL